MVTFVAALVSVLLPACGSDSPPSQPGRPDASPEAGPNRDAGNQPTDAGQPDRISPPDAGTVSAQAGGSPRAITLGDHWAYITIGPRLTIWDVSAPSAPSLRGETIPFDEVLNGVAIAGSVAYVSEAKEDGNGLIRVIDVTNPTAPAEIASFELGTSTALEHARGLAVIAKQLFVGSDTTIRVFNLENPRAPALVQSIKRGADHFRLVGKRLYYWLSTLSHGIRLGALDTTANLAEIGAASYELALGADVADGDLVVITGGGGTRVFDASKPSAPGQPLFTSEIQSRTLVALGATAWVPAWDGLHALDLSNPKAITDTGPIAMPSEGVEDADMLGNLLGVVTDRGRLLTVDVTQPRAPVSKAVAEISLCSSCVGIQAAGGNLVIGAGSAGLRTGRVSDLKFLGSAYPYTPGALLDFEGVAIDGNIAYVADWAGGGLRIYDISDPARPKPLAQLAGGYFASIAYASGRVYMGQRTNGGVLVVIDVSDPSHPKELGAIATDAVSAIALRGPLAFVADDAGLKILDVSNPESIALVGQYECQEPHSVALSGNIAALGCYDAFHFVDVSNPAAPSKKSAWAPRVQGAHDAVAVSGSRMYLGHNDGVTVVDLAEPAAPKVIDQWPTSYGVSAVTMSADRVIAACSLGGVYAWSPGSK